MGIELLDFDKPTVSQYASLLNSASVQRHMPLSDPSYSDEWISNWIKGKSKTWENPNKGPWSVWVNGQFAGWAGVEPCGDELSFGIVLLQSFWGQGELVVHSAFEKIQSEFPHALSVIVELPLSRKSARYSDRLGLIPLGTVEIAGQEFANYRKNLR